MQNRTPQSAVSSSMEARAKITISILLIIVLGIALWQLTASALMPQVGQKYAKSATYSSRGSWALLERTAYGSIFLAFSIANLTYPQVTLPPTIYSLVISNDNQTVSNSFVRGFGVRATTLTVQDIFDGSTRVTGDNNLADAVQVVSNLNLRTSGLHQIRFTVTYEVINIFLVGYSNDHSMTRSFNITQAVP